MSRFIPSIVFFLLCALMLRGLIMGPESAQQTAVMNLPVPAFDLPVLDSATARFRPDALRGKVSIVQYFATWCGVCMREQPRMAALSKKLKIPFYGVAWRDDPRMLAAWKMRGNIPYTLVGIDNTGAAGIGFGITGVPQTFLIDKQGLIRYRFMGMIPDEELQETLIPLVETLRHAS